MSIQNDRMETTEIKLLQGIDTIIVRVRDIETSKVWYLEKLQLNLVYEDRDMKLVVLDPGGPTSLTLWQTEQPLSFRRDTTGYPIFKTPDADRLREKLREAGVAVGDIVQDAQIKYFSFSDIDDNLMEACQVVE